MPQLSKLSELNIYPIKSTRVIHLDQARVEARGIQWDRRWMLVDAAGKFITGRQQPILATVVTQIVEPQLQISAQGREPLLIPLADSGPGELSVEIWRDQCPVSEVSSKASDWFSRLLGIACRLVRLSDQDIRPVDGDYGQAGDQVSLADGFPLLLIGEASLVELNRRLRVPVLMNRFRPNLVVTTDEPFIEDNWRRIRVNGLEFDLVKACSRCVFTTIDPQTGTKDPGLEPLRTLSNFRRRPEGGVLFGQNAIPRGEGVHERGAELEVLD